MNEAPPPLLVVLSGPSGVGKDAVLRRLRESGFPLGSVVTATTRPRRPQEKEGKEGADYHFVSSERFEQMKQNGELLEWAQVYGHWYGVPRQSVREVMGQGKDTIIKVDIQGAATLKGLLPEAVFIFLAPPRMEELVDRLRHRHTESPGELAVRLNKATEEMKLQERFDYVVVNDEVEKAVGQILAIITAEKCRPHPRQVQL